MWRPPRPALDRLRAAIDDKPEAWRRVRRAVERAGWALDGDSLQRMPRGWPVDHPDAEDIRRTDQVLTFELSEREACTPGFDLRFAELCRSAAPLLAFQCAALGLPW